MEPGKKVFTASTTSRIQQNLLPPLHIKLGRTKNFVRTMDQVGPALRYFAKKFPGISPAKIKEGVSIGPQIRQFYRDVQLDCLLSG